MRRRHHHRGHRHRDRRGTLRRRHHRDDRRRDHPDDHRDHPDDRRGRHRVHRDRHRVHRVRHRRDDRASCPGSDEEASCRGSGEVHQDLPSHRGEAHRKAGYPRHRNRLDAEPTAAGGLHRRSRRPGWADPDVPGRDVTAERRNRRRTGCCRPSAYAGRALVPDDAAARREPQPHSRPQAARKEPAAERDAETPAWELAARPGPEPTAVPARPRDEAPRDEPVCRRPVPPPAGPVRRDRDARGTAGRAGRWALGRDEVPPDAVRDRDAEQSRKYPAAARKDAGPKARRRYRRALPGGQRRDGDPDRTNDRLRLRRLPWTPAACGQPAPQRWRTATSRTPRDLATCSGLAYW